MYTFDCNLDTRTVNLSVKSPFQPVGEAENGYPLSIRARHFWQPLTGRQRGRLNAYDLPQALEDL